MSLLFRIGFLDFGFIDVIDILMVSLLLYNLYKLLRGSVAVRIFLGLLFIYLIYLVVRAAEMKLLTAILGQFIGVGMLAAVILFQQEIRKFLLLVGRTTAFENKTLTKYFNWGPAEGTEVVELNKVMKACEELAAEYTGALIVFSKSTDLQHYVDTGDEIDATISKRLLLTIFNKYSPLHDGAVIITNGRIKAARCILPVTENENLPAQMGLRHRAAIGMTEVTDTAVLIVSEETGKISLSYGGEAFQETGITALRAKLSSYLADEHTVEEEHND